MLVPCSTGPWREGRETRERYERARQVQGWCKLTSERCAQWEGDFRYINRLIIAPRILRKKDSLCLMYSAAPTVVINPQVLLQVFAPCSIADRSEHQTTLCYHLRKCQRYWVERQYRTEGSPEAEMVPLQASPAAAFGWPPLSLMGFTLLITVLMPLLEEAWSVCRFLQVQAALQFKRNNLRLPAFGGTVLWPSLTIRV